MDLLSLWKYGGYMFLSELVAYATKKYNLIENKKIEKLFEFSVLTDSKSKLW